MNRALVHGETLDEFFLGLVEDAFQHQRVQALDVTRFYLVRLLTRRARLDHEPTRPDPEDEPLVVRLARALETGGARQRAELRDLADHALFIAGFFSDSLARRLVDVDYYASVGGFAYQHLSAFNRDPLTPTFSELGQRFLAFADVLTEVSEQGALTSDTNLLRLYERWQRYGSQRNGERLLRRGVLPNPQTLRAADRVH